MNSIIAIMSRELKGYFGTPVAWVFLVIFTLMSGVATFYLGNFFARGTADLNSYFSYLPWLFLVFIPAVSMRLWAEERKSGTIELLMTLPVSPLEAVIGKWLAGVIFMGVALIATFPLWASVNYLGNPDNGVIIINYLGSLGMAAVLMAIGAAMSALTRNQVIAFVLSVAVSFVVITSGTPIVLDAVRVVAPQVIVDLVASMSALTHFTYIAQGIVPMASVIYLVSMICFWLFVNVVILSIMKAD